MYPKYKCFGCGKIFRSKEIPAICPVCRGKGVKIKGEIKAGDIDIPRWDKVIEKAEKFIDKSRRS